MVDLVDPDSRPHPTGPSADPAPRPARRRFQLGAVAAVAGGTVLAGCQSNPGMTPMGPVVRADTGGDWMEMVRAEHRAVDALFQRILATNDPAERARLRNMLSDALTRHAVQEENALYPALALAGMKTEPPQLYADHSQVKVLLAELDVLPFDHPAWPARVKHLQTIVQRHVQEEETQIYPAFARSLNPAQNAAIATRYRREGARFRPV
jgi:hemerythrin superfamily protein